MTMENRTPWGRVGQLALAACVALLALLALAAAARADFGVAAFDASMTANPAGDPYTQAGGHPYAVTTSIVFNTETDPVHGGEWPVEPVKDIDVVLPPGLVGNPTAVPRCALEDFEAQADTDTSGLSSKCPAEAQVGLLRVTLNGFSGFPFPQDPVPIYNLEPLPGSPATFGGKIVGVPVFINARVDGSNDYRLSIVSEDITEVQAVIGVDVEFWGVPADPSHDSVRSCPNKPTPPFGGPTCASDAEPAAFLTNATQCTPAGEGLPWDLFVDSWENPGVFVQAGFESHLPPGHPGTPDTWGPPQGPTGCDQVPFDPALTLAPDTAETAGPSGYQVDLSLPQSDDPTEIAQGHLRSAVVTLPAGVRVSPSSANGLGACTPAQIGLGTGVSPTCPDSSKIGSIRIDTPLLDDPLTGFIYLAKPHENPSGTLLAIYLVAEGPGVSIKLPGRIDADPGTGRLTATFDDNPQLPFSNLHLEFWGGDGAALSNPPECGTYTTTATLTSWSGATATSESSFVASRDGSGASCPPRGFAPGFSAGVIGTSPDAGDDSSFSMLLTRSDRDQELGSVAVELPEGLTARIKNATQCADAAAAAGTCGEESRIGTVTTGVGPGGSPFYLDGRVYVTGPYNGGAFGLSIVVPAIAGPFDLGTVVVRAAIRVDKATSALSIVSDSLPTILQGIPLQMRSINIRVDRPEFMINPTDCGEKEVRGTIGSTQGASAAVASRFRVGECAALSFKPRMSLKVGGKGHTKAGQRTPLAVTLRQPGSANLQSVSVVLPMTLNARLDVINRACTLEQFHAGTCTSKTGTATAVTPLLATPLKGDVYFVKNPARVIPDLMVALRGEVDIDLTGKVSIPGGKRLATKFDTIPDVPITRFTMKLAGNSDGPISVARNLCSFKGRTGVVKLAFKAQNGKVVKKGQWLKVAGCKKKRR